MTERDIKLLWGRSGNRCAICRIELSQDKKLSSAKYPLGEQCHITGEKDSAARGESNLSEGERDGYANRILLCPNHHVEIDRDEEHFSVERLHFIKQQHELWVQEKLSEHVDERQQADELFYSVLIDAAVEDCYFSEWQSWIPTAAGGAFAQWPESIIKGIANFHDRVFRAPWPGANKELERALKTLAIALFRAVETFLHHAEYEHHQKIYLGVSFYNKTWHEQAVYDRLAKEFDLWCAEYTFWLKMATKAANWLSDVVRRDINPMFFSERGRFTYERVWDGLAEKVPEFRMSEKRRLPTIMNNLRLSFVQKIEKQQEN